MNDKNGLDKEAQLASFVDLKFKESMVSKAELVKEWKTYMNAYEGEFTENVNKPDYKSVAVSNYIFSTIETVRPIMLDGNPRFEVIAKNPDKVEEARAVDFLLQCEFDREKIKQKSSKELINTLVYGTSIFYIPWNVKKKETNVVPVSIFNIFPDPLATSIEDAEYIIYADYFHVNQLKRQFPKHAKRLVGSNINHSELVSDNNKTAVRIDNQVLVCEMWLHDWTSVDVEDDKDSGKEFIRQIICAPELGLILLDQKSPYNDDELPFVVQKCYDMPNKFWGVGEVKRLLSPQTQLNELTASIVDNAKMTSNAQWIIDKNSGIPVGKITNRQGLIIRKNPGSEVRRETPPAMPAYVQNIAESFKYDIEQISGVHDSLKGNSEKGVYTAQGILSLQEAGQARIRFKTRNIEDALGAIGIKIFNRDRQFWKDDKYVSKVDDTGNIIYKLISKKDLDIDFDIKIQAASTMQMNKAAMFDLMIRMAQTSAEDGLPMVDRIAVLQYMPGFDSKSILDRFERIKEEQKQNAINEQEHVQTHDETQAVLQDIVAEMQKINQELAELRGQYDKDNDEAQLEQLKEQAFNEGYGEYEKLMKSNKNMEEQKNETIPPEIIDMISQLSDAELMELLQTNPELEDLINSELEMNKQEFGTTQEGIQGGEMI